MLPDLRIALVLNKDQALALLLLLSFARESIKTGKWNVLVDLVLHTDELHALVLEEVLWQIRAENETSVTDELSD